LKLNGTHQLMLYADVNTLGRSVHTTKKNTDTSVVASKENGLEEMLLQLSTWSCLGIKMQDEVTV
jgi:hypothetical protein